MGVRRASVRDVNHIAQLVDKMTEGFKGGQIVWAFDKDSAKRRLAFAILSANEELFYSGTGFLLANIYPLSFNAKVFVASELGFYDEAGNGGKLLEAFEAWARERGARMIDVATIAGARDAAVGRLYERRGFSRSEIHYVKRLR